SDDWSPAHLPTSRARLVQAALLFEGADAPSVMVTKTSMRRARRREFALMFQNRRQNVFIQQFNFRRDHPGGLTGRIEHDDRIEIGDDDGLLCIETERRCPLNGAVLVQ